MLASGLFGLLGVVLGWGLNQLSHYIDNKPKLVFMVADSHEILSPKEQRNKTSFSEYNIEIVNIGKVPVILERLSLYNKSNLLIDCILDDDQRKILPNRSKCYKMMEQDTEALKWHCNKQPFLTCDVIAYCYNGQQIKGKLDVCACCGNIIVNYNLMDGKETRL